MRFRTIVVLTLTALCLTACGTKATPAVAPVPSAGILPLVASATPGATATPAATAPVRPADGQTTVPPSAVAATPTPLATPVPVAGTRTPVATRGAPSATAQAAATTAPRATAEPQRTTRMTALPDAAPQQAIGTTQDGLTILNVRVGKNEGFTRIVFDLAKQDGTAAPVPLTRLWRQGDTVIVAFGGVRADVFGQSLGGGEQVINTGAVQSVYRIPIRDDAAAAYGIAVHGGAKTTLSAASSPTRVIVDIADA